MYKKIFFAAALALVLTLSAVLPVIAAPPEPSLDGAQSVYLWCAESNEAIIYKSGGEKIYPASTVKMMTGLVAIELIGNRLDERVTMTQEMLSHKRGTSMQLKAGETLSYRDLLYATVCGGFNDAAYALAVASAGSADAFVERMNEKAHSLGALDTYYTNPTGWHDPAMVTTLSDTAKIAKAAYKDALYLHISSVTSYTVPANNVSEAFTVRNRNGLIGSFYTAGYYNRHAKGLAAGMTDEGGYCVATYFEYDGLSFLAIVMGGEKRGEQITSYAIANELIDYAVYYYGSLDIMRAGDYICELPVSLAPSPSGKEHYMLDATVAEDISLYLPYDRNSLDTLEKRYYLYSDELRAPISEGEVIGGVDFYIDGAYRGTADLVASESVLPSAFLTAMDSARSFMLGRAFVIAVIIFLALFGFYYYTIEIKLRRKRTKNLKFKNIY